MSHTDKDDEGNGMTLFQCKLDKSVCDHEWNNEGVNPTQKGAES